MLAAPLDSKHLMTVEFIQFIRKDAFALKILGENLKYLAIYEIFVFKISFFYQCNHSSNA